MDQTTHEENKLSGIFCHIFGHHYTVSKRVTKHITEYKCLHCKKEVTTDENGNLSNLTPVMRDINKTLEEMYLKRNRRAAKRQVA